MEVAPSLRHEEVGHLLRKRQGATGFGERWHVRAGCRHGKQWGQLQKLLQPGGRNQGRAMKGSRWRPGASTKLPSAARARHPPPSPGTCVTSIASGWCGMSLSGVHSNAFFSGCLGTTEQRDGRHVAWFAACQKHARLAAAQQLKRALENRHSQRVHARQARWGSVPAAPDQA
jgi:hypothetical protein